MAVQPAARFRTGRPGLQNVLLVQWLLWRFRAKACSWTRIAGVDADLRQETLQNANWSPALIPSNWAPNAPESSFRLGLIEARPRLVLFDDLDFAAPREGAARLFVTLARFSVA